MLIEILGIGGVATATWLLLARIKQNRSRVEDAPLPVSITSEATIPFHPFTINPLAGVSFDASRKPEFLSEAIHKNVIGSMMTSYGIEATNAAMQIILLQKDGLLVSFHDESYELVRAANGTFKAMTRASDGTFHEIATLDTFGTWLNRMSHSSAVVIMVAHLISNADISKRLGQVQKDVDRLLEHRKTDIRVEIRTAYESLREQIGKQPLESKSVAEIREVFRKERHRLFGDAQSEVNRLTPILRTKVTNKIERFAKKGKLKERERALERVMTTLQDASYCLQMEALAAAYCGAEEDQRRLYSEASDEWSGLALQIKELESEIKMQLPLSTKLQEIAAIWRDDQIQDQHGTI